MPSDRSLHILFFADDTHIANAIVDHIDANLKYSRHHWTIINPVGIQTADAINFNHFDAIAIHYSVCILFDWMLKPAIIEKIKNFKGPKIQFVQDEYRWVNQISGRAAELGINTLFSLAAPESVERLYGHPGLRDTKKVSVLAGYVPENMENIEAPPINGRPFDMIYRSRIVPFYLGLLGNDKKRMAQGIERLAPQYDLRVDVSVAEEKRVYGQRWLDFLRSGRVVLGTEGGSSIVDFDGSAEAAVKEYLTDHPAAEFEEVHQAVLQPYEGNLMYNTMSPRIFEAAAIRTPMVLFPGWYNGVVEADKHYIALEKDFSNFAEVARKVRDTTLLEDIAARTYEDLVQSKKYTMQSYINIVDDAVTDMVVGNTKFAGIMSTPPHFKNKEQAKRYLNKSIRWERRLYVLGKVKQVLLRAIKHFGIIIKDPELTLRQKIKAILFEGISYSQRFWMRKKQRIDITIKRYTFYLCLPLKKLYAMLPWVHPYWRAFRRTLQLRCR